MLKKVRDYRLLSKEDLIFPKIRKFNTRAISLGEMDNFNAP